MNGFGFGDVELEQMRRSAGAAADLLKVLANRNRLLILCHLAEGEASVSELNGKLELSQSALSQYLAVLREQRLVSTRRESQTIYYSLVESDAIAVIRALHDVYCS